MIRQTFQTIFSLITSCIVCILYVQYQAAATSLRKLSDDLTSIYIIGDLHADVDCAKQWVERTGLVNMTSVPYTWIGGDDEAIVFLGDYVDKGSKSEFVLKFVRELQETFEDHVVTMLGNHDFFLVLDTMYNAENHPLGFPFYEYAYAFMHPEEYLESTFVSRREGDKEVLDSILSSLGSVYDQGLQGSLHLCTYKCSSKSQKNLFQYVPPFDRNETLREETVKRLQEWRTEYADGLYASGLLKWLVKQPLVAIVGDSLLVHGGISSQVIDFVHNLSLQNGNSIANQLDASTNIPFHLFFENYLVNNESRSNVEASMTPKFSFEIILDMVQHRGYFDTRNGCSEVDKVLKMFKTEEVTRVIVGHTPHDSAFEMCDGKLLASDSSLSSSFRAYGNLYCPLRDSFFHEDRILHNSNSCRISSGLRTCKGSISRL